MPNVVMMCLILFDNSVNLFVCSHNTAWVVGLSDYICTGRLASSSWP